MGSLQDLMEDDIDEINDAREEQGLRPLCPRCREEIDENDWCSCFF